MSNPQDAFKKLQRMAAQAGKGGGPSPRGMAGGVTGLLLLGGVAVVGQNALFNVDGGHRAIKYTRIGGVSKEIYSEGKEMQHGRLQEGQSLTIYMYRNTFQDSMVRDSYRLRRSCETKKCSFFDWYEGFANGQYYLSCSIETSSGCATTNLSNIRYRL